MDIISKFKDVKVLVIGDVMLDRYWWGDVTRISPEAPVPVVRLNRTTITPGGAANVAVNVAGLGAVPSIIGAIGGDAEGSLLCELIESAGISTAELLRSEIRQTTVKTRLLAHNQQIARVDQESVEPLNADVEERLLTNIERLLDGTNVVVLSDYAKGVLSENILEKVIYKARERDLPIVVDPKGREYLRYRGTTVVTPNRREAALACNLDDNGKEVVLVAGARLLADLGLKAVLITEGGDGMTLFETDAQPFHFVASAREVYDSTGAGDTVIATLAVSLGAGLKIREAARIANVAAGIVVEHVGTAAVDLTVLAASIDRSTFQTAQ